jgi:hypothetical protein
MKYLKYILTVSVFASIIFACSDDYLEENPPHIIAADNLYVDMAGFDAGLNGLYAQFRRERSGENWGSANDLMIDPAVTGVDNCYGNQRSGWASVGNQFDTKNVTTESHNRHFFEWIYKTINAANTIIIRAENPEIEWTETEKNQVLAEAQLIRAWAYRHATYMWGDVPLNLNESSGANIITDWKRAPVAEVRAQMEIDLLFAEANLPETSSNGGKVVKAVASHYLAELYLAMGDAGNAKIKAQAAIDGPASLVTSRYGVRSNQPGTPFTDMFVAGNSNIDEGNTEALWVMQHALETIGGGDNIMRRWNRNRSHSVKIDGMSVIAFDEANGGRGLGRTGPTRYALELYDPSDDRGGVYAWRTYEVLNNPDKIPDGWALGDTTWFSWKGKDEKIKNSYWPSTRKWDYFNPADPAGARSYNDQVYLRLAETYLLLAEAQFALSELGNAAETINVLRRRANAPEIVAGDVSIDFILDERSRELYSEEHRRYTLVRLGKWLERTQLHNKVGGPTAGDKDKLFPIPQSVIDANLTSPMRQNPGYSAE